MGYFANGSEGEGYRETYCARCRNNGDEKYEEGCTVWDLHLVYNGDQFKESPQAKVIGTMLEMFIPRANDEHSTNLQCTMFRPLPDSEDHP